MDKGLFANDGSFMERFKQMQQEKEKAAAAGGSLSVAPNPVNPKQPVVAVVANKRPVKVKKSGPIGSGLGGKLAFSLKKAKIAVAPVFAPDDEDDDAAVVQKEGSMKKPVQADKLTAAALTGPVGNRLFFFFFWSLPCFLFYIVVPSCWIIFVPRVVVNID
jgi:splicing factor 4